MQKGVIQKQKLKKVRDNVKKNGKNELRLMIGAIGLIWVCIGKENICLISLNQKFFQNPILIIFPKRKNVMATRTGLKYWHIMFAHDLPLK